MNLDRIAIAGADENVRPEDLLELNKRFPFVEWSILYDTEVKALNRFPSLEWIAELVRLSRQQEAETGSPLRLSLHLCRTAVKGLVRGNLDVLSSIEELMPAFGRIQLNVIFKNVYEHLTLMPKNIKRLNHSYQIIVQLNGTQLNKEVGALLEDSGLDVAYLYDSSGGHGKTASVWLPPFGKYCGYAGGLSPENLEEEIPRIAAVTGEHPIYLDMESGVRDIDDHFDISRAEIVLKIAEARIGSEQ